LLKEQIWNEGEELCGIRFFPIHAAAIEEGKFRIFSGGRLFALSLQVQLAPVCPICL